MLSIKERRSLIFFGEERVVFMNKFLIKNQKNVVDNCEWEWLDDVDLKKW